MEADDLDERVSWAARHVVLLSGKLLLGAIVIAGSAMILSPALSEPEVESPKAIAATDHIQHVHAGAFSPDGRTLATCGLDNAVRLWNLSEMNDGPGAPTAVLPDKTIQYSVAFSPDGSLVGAVGPESLTIWSGKSGRYQQVLRKETETSSCLAFSPDGHTVAIGHDDGTVSLDDLPSGRTRAVLRAHGNVVRSLSFSPDGHFLVSAGQDSLIMLWDAARGVAIRALMEIASNPLHIVSFSPDGGNVAVGELGGRPTDVLLLDPETGAVRARLSGHAQGVCALAFSPDGRTLATAGVDHSVKLWNLAERREQTTLYNDFGTVKSLSFSRDGDWLALAGDGVTLRVRDTERPKSPRLGLIHLTNPQISSRVRTSVVKPGV